MERHAAPEAPAAPQPGTLKRHCPRLGGRVSLDYCRENGSDPPPCDKIRDCWWERLEIDRYLSQYFSPQRLEQIARRRPKEKIASLLELIAKAREQGGA